MLRVRLDDGHFKPVIVVRLQVARAGEAHSHPFGRGSFGGRHPGGFRVELPQRVGEGSFPPINTPEPKRKF